MAYPELRFGCTALLGTNKAGTLTPNADGYYPMVLGALDFSNSGGQPYPYASAKELFKEGSSFMRRIKNGCCRGEYGHPRRESGQDYRSFYTRILDIVEKNVSHHITDVWLDFTSVKGPDGRPCIAIMGLVKPCGPYGHVLKEQIENGKENVCFSIRCLTNDVYRRGVMEKNIKLIVTWDYVNEPGISVANKYAAPALESFMDDVIPETVLYDEAVLEGVGMESDAAGLAREVREIATCLTAPVQRPGSAKW